MRINFSLEHNLAVHAFMARLHEVTEQDVFQNGRDLAQTFIAKMLDPGQWGSDNGLSYIKSGIDPIIPPEDGDAEVPLDACYINKICVPSVPSAGTSCIPVDTRHLTLLSLPELSVADVPPSDWVKAYAYYPGSGLAFDNGANLEDPVFAGTHNAQYEISAQGTLVDILHEGRVYPGPDFTLCDDLQSGRIEDSGLPGEAMKASNGPLTFTCFGYSYPDNPYLGATAWTAFVGGQINPYWWHP